MAGDSEFRQGWRTVVASSFGVAVGLGGIPYFTLGVFLKPLTEEFGWSRAEVAATSLCLSIGSGATAPFIGRLADAIDVRRIVLISMAALALAWLGLTQINGDIRSLYFALTLLALVGCGTSPLIFTLTISTWFDRARGLALGLTLAGSGLAAILAPRLVDRMIQAHGWQGGYVGIAVFTGLVALPLVALIFPGKNPALKAGDVALAGMTLGQAVRSMRFWQLAIGICGVAGAVGGTLVHLVPFLTDAGMARDRATAIAGVLGLAVVAGRLGSGALIDRFHAPYVAGLLLAMPVLSFGLMAAAPGANGPMILAVLVLGIAAGAEVDLLAYLAGRLFGLKAFGAIYGLLLVPFLLGGGLGPILMGRVHDVTGSYAAGLLPAAVICLVGAGLMAALGRFPAGGATGAAGATPPGFHRPGG